MLALAVAILGAIPVIGPIVKAWADRREQANRPDIIKAQTAQVISQRQDQTRAEEGQAMGADAPKSQAALDKLRQEAAE